MADYDNSRSIVDRVMAATPSGSYLTLWDDTAIDEAVVAANEGYAETGAVPYIPRTVEQVAGYFENLELVQPGVVPVSQWRPNAAEVGTPEPVTGHGAVGRKR